MIVYGTIPSETVCQEADRLTSGERQKNYGHPHHDFSRQAKLWSVILGMEVTPVQVGLCMIAVKISRHINRPKRDNLVDICGYAKCVDVVEKYVPPAPAECPTCVATGNGSPSDYP